MSASSALERRSAGDAERSEPKTPRPWIGVDFSGASRRRPTRALIPLVALALCAALGVAALRIDLIRTRYAVAAAMAEENALIEAQRALIVRRRQLRDPVELAIQARERGFRTPAHVLTLPEPSLPRGLAETGRPTLPAVSAGPAPAEPRSEWQ